MLEVSLTPQAQAFLLVAIYLLGAATRVVWPFAVAYLTEPQSFDWGKAKSQIVGTAVGLIGILLSGVFSQGFVEGLLVAGIAGSFIAGYGAASVGRGIAKTVDLRKN